MSTGRRRVFFGRRLAGRLRLLAGWIAFLLAWAGFGAGAFAFARLIDAEALGQQRWNASWTHLLLAVGAGLALVAGVMWWLSHTGLAPAPEDDLFEFVPDSAEVPSYDVVPTLMLVIDTSRYSPRTVERVRYADGYYEHELLCEFQIPAMRWRQSLGEAARSAVAGPRSLNVLLPVLRIGRGFIIDNLEVCLAGGGRMSTLNAGEYLSVVEDIVKRSVLALEDTNEFDQAMVKPLQELIHQVRYTHLREDFRDTWKREGAAIELLDLLLNLEPPARYARAERLLWYEVRLRLHQFIEAICDAHIVFAPVTGKSGDRIVIRYTYTTPHHPEQRQPIRQIVARRLGRERFSRAPRRLGLRDSLRYAIGLRPHVHRIPISAHRWSQSYHFEFSAPSETYVYACDIRATEDLLPGDLPGSIVAFPVDGSRGCDYAHIYVRETGRDEYRDRLEMIAVLDCREKPPGMLGAIAVVALAQAVLIWVIGWHLSLFFAQDDKQHALADLPALLLAVPGLITGFFGVQFAGEKLRTTSLSTVVGVLGCGLLAIASTALALAKTTGDAYGAFFGVAHPFWLGLMLLSAVLTLDLLGRGILRTRRYVKRINLPGDDRMAAV